MAKRILVIDDEKDLRKLLEYNLRKEGYEVTVAASGEEGLERARSSKPDLVILDLMLPGVDGLEVCRLLRGDPRTRQIPVVMLTAKTSEIDQVVGLEVGASDYVAKPFSVKVLLARVKTALRQRGPGRPDEKVMTVGDFTLDRDCQSLTVGGKPVALTRLEFRIMGCLMAHPGKVHSRDELLSGAWDDEAFVVDRTVDVHVKSIRQKLGKFRDWVETVRGSGYRFAEPDDA